MIVRYRLLALALASAFVIAACNQQPAPSTPDSAANATADSAKDAELAAKEAELKQREEEVAKKEAELAAQQPAEKPVEKPAAPVKKPAAPKPEVASTPKPTPPAPPKPVIVPAGTQLTVSLLSDLTSKTAKVGDRFHAAVVNDVMVDGKRAIPAGAHVVGTVTDVVSGSQKIGGIPTLGLRMDTLVFESGQEFPITGELVEKGKSDTGRDTAKIVGGAAAGAILGHQVKGGSGGKIIGGLLGGAIGAVVAKNTGTEVTLAQNSQLTISLGAPIEVKP